MTHRLREALSASLAVARSVLFSSWWVSLAPACGIALGAFIGWRTGSWGSFFLFLRFFLHAAAGLVGSYSLHEAGHAFVLRLCPGVETIRVENTALRVSVIAAGTITTRQALLVAAAGPAPCICVGAFLSLIPPLKHLSWWYLGHAVFLLPLFGDGRAVIGFFLKALRKQRHERPQV